MQIFFRIFSGSFDTSGSMIPLLVPEITPGESEHLFGTIVGQYRRLISTCAVRAQAMCLLARVGLITPAARDAARRRQVAMRMEAQIKKERKA